jgi:hypothetical protein
MFTQVGTLPIRRILLVSLLPGAVLVILQSAWLAVQLLMGYRGADSVVEVTVGLVLGMLAWLCTAVVLILKSSQHREHRE